MPQNLSATAVSSSQIDLSWDASTDNVAMAGYRIYRDNALVHTSATNAYSDTGLDPATEYEYEVSAIDAVSNESARSDPDSATTAASGDTEAPSIPQNLVATAVSSAQIDLTWDASTDNVAVTGYNIFRDNVLVDTSPTNAYADTGLNPGTLYQYEVSAFDAASNESARSAPDSATTQAATDTEAPSIPQNLSATAASSSQIDLTWDASTDNVAVTGYNIYRDDVLVDTSPTNAYADSGLAPGTQYQYEVSALDAASNESARSAPDSATTHQVIVTAGLLAEWRFDAGAGQVLTDYSGNGHHGQLGQTAGIDVTDPTWTSQGLLFDAINDVVGCGTLGISGGVARSVIAVVAPLDAGSGNTSFGLGWQGDGTNFKRWTMRSALNTDDFRFEIQGIGVTQAAMSFDAGVWAFVAVTQSGNNMNTVSMYKDNQNPIALSASQVINTTGDFAFGNTSGGGVIGGHFGYALVYNRALAPGEVAQNRQALKDALAARGITLP